MRKKGQLIKWAVIGLGLLLYVMPLWVHAQSDEQRQQVENLIWEYHLREASRALATWPSSTDRSYYEANIALYRYITSQSPADLATFNTIWDRASAALAKKSDQSAKVAALLADLHLKKAVVAFLNEEYLTTLLRAREARSLWKQAEKLQPSLPEVKKVAGVFNVVFGVVPKKYQWLSNGLGYTGDISTGIRQLTESAKSGHMLHREGVIIAAWAEKQFLNRPEAGIARLKALENPQRPSHLLAFLEAILYLQLKQTDKALAILKNRDAYKQNPQVDFIVYWDYLQGKGQYFQENYLAAQGSLSRFVRDYQGKWLLGDATFKLGMALTLSGHYPTGKVFFRQMANGNGGFEEDEYARYVAGIFQYQPPGESQVWLWKARNRFDGGFFKESMAHLAALQHPGVVLTTEERTELYYRLGRVFEAQKNLGKARESYQKCVAENPQQMRWLQAYACYYLGEIAHFEGKMQESKQYYQQALSYDHIFYQAGLESNCKTALSKLKTP